MTQPILFSGTPEPFTPTSAPQATFFVPQISMTEQELVGTELFRHNIVPVTDEMFHTHLILAIFEEEDEPRATDMADQVEEMWTCDELHQDAMNLYQAQVDQRKMDIEQGVDASMIPEPEVPKHPMDRRRRAETQVFLDELRQKSQKVRDLTVRKMNYGIHQLSGTARILLHGWEGLKTPFVKENGIVPQETYNAMAEEIGRVALQELERDCITKSVLSNRERGNSDSPQGSESEETGSPSPSGASENSDGNSTESFTTPAQETGSEKITDVVSGSTSPSAGQTSTAGDTQQETT